MNMEITATGLFRMRILEGFWKRGYYCENLFTALMDGVGGNKLIRKSIYK